MWHVGISKQLQVSVTVKIKVDTQKEGLVRSGRKDVLRAVSYSFPGFENSSSRSREKSLLLSERRRGQVEL
jgi:hypothetical protein